MGSTKELIQSGKKYLEEGKFNEALDCFEQLLVSDPQNPNLLNLKERKWLASFIKHF